MRLSFAILLYTILFIGNANGQSPNYALLSNWAAHGAKMDYADSIPKKLRKTSNSNKQANVFFIHPTTYITKDAYKQKWNAAIEDIDLNKKTDETTILFQASCFNEVCTVYAPRYRQAHIYAFYINDENGKAALDTAYNDVKAAFEYFLKNLNNDMPIIIAAHSQGTVHAAHLIKDYFEEKPLQKKLVAAYLIGMPIRKDYFNYCKPCMEANSNNCFVSWRSFLKNSKEEPFLKLEPQHSVYVTNPINWTLDSLSTTRRKNDGAVLLNFNKVYKKVSAAQIHNNILWVTKPKFPFSFLVKNKRTNYHIADINLFYVNIRENVKQRVENYVKTSQSQN